MGDLQSDNENYQTEYATMAEDYRSLYDSYEALVRDRKTMDLQLSNLRGESEALQENIDQLTSLLALYQVNNTQISGDYQTLFQYLQTVNGLLYALQENLELYCRVPEAFPRVLNGEAVSLIEEPTLALVDTLTTLEAYDAIYAYITGNVEYVYDVDFPYVASYMYVEDFGMEVYQSLNMSSVRNYVQEPKYTMEYGQGDCDDQSVLAHAMITLYHESHPSPTTAHYIATMEFQDGSGHMAVFIIQNGELCIMDPAGHHLTRIAGVADYRSPSSELSDYEDQYISSNGGISNIKIYSLNSVNGEGTLKFNGSLEDAATFLD